MRITAQLAKSQLKINRSRTKWSIIAIVLSTALMTAILCFIASGNAMFVRFLGEDYGEYAQSYRVILLIPIVVFAILVMSMTITVISNVFRISTQDRISQFGILKCTGATPKQIKETVMYESVWLCVVGIPLGIIFGIALDFIGVRIANYFFNDLNELTNIMIQEFSLTLDFILPWRAILFSAVLSALIVFYSAWRPAHKTSRIPAIQCIYGTENINIDEKPYKENKIIYKLFGFEGVLADKNLKRNHRNFRATVIALSIGVILFISLAGLADQAKGLQDFMNPNVSVTMIADYTSDYTEKLNENTGRYETTFLKPIDSLLGEKITQELEKYKDTYIWGMGNDMDTYYTVLSEASITEKMQKVYEKTDLNEYEFEVEIIALDKDNYEKLCGIANVPIGSNILLNNYSYNDFGYQTNIEPLCSDINKLKLMKADGSSEDIDIQGILTQEEMSTELFYPAARPIRLVVPYAMLRGFSWYGLTDDEKGFRQYANQVMDKFFPSNTSELYMENGFSKRVYRLEEYMKVMNIAISLVSVFMYSFVALLMLIGLTNVISTLSTNVMTRAKEFAILKSVGMTSEGLRNMLNYESILCSLKAITIGIPIGVLITILINLPIRMTYPITYKFPLFAILLCTMVVVFITLGTTRYASHKLEGQNIIEAIRSACGK